MYLSRRVVVSIFLIAISLFVLPKSVYADGTYYNIGTAHSSLGSADAVSWSQSNPLMIDSFGHYISYFQTTGNEYYWAFSNDKGATWKETLLTGIVNIRMSMVYDPINDLVHVLHAGADGVTYSRYIVRRDKNNNVVDLTADPSLTTLTLDGSATGCTSVNTGFPVLQFKNTGTNGMLAAFWSVNKTCSGISVTESRGAMITLTNTSSDGSASSWKALNGVSDAGSAVGPAKIDYNLLYGYTGTYSNPADAALIRGGTGTKANDIYFFNIDENEVNGYRRLAWNSGSNNWSGTWTARVTFGGAVNNASGYNQKDQLLSKPVYASGQDKVYIGIARWLDNTNGDTQSLFSVDSSDTVSLVKNIYSAGGAHCLYPTFDLAYDSNQNKLYFSYIISGALAVCGNGYYVTYDGTSFSSPIAFQTTVNRSLDIPIMYYARQDDRILWFYRLNNASTPSTPPHEVYFGYIGLNSTAVSSSVSVTTGQTLSSVTDLNPSCVTKTNTEITDTSGGEVALTSGMRDDFMTPTSPYKYLPYDFWTTGVWTSGTYDPTPNGNLLVYNSAGGAYLLGKKGFSQKTLEFRAKFTSNNDQHIGWADGTGFNNYVIFSTHNNGQLNTRVQLGSGETQVSLGTSYLGAFHKYKIDWNATDIKFYVDDVLVNTNSATTTSTYYPIASNNANVAGSDLTLDWINVYNYPSTTGTYTTCALTSGVSNTRWDILNFSTSTPAPSSLTMKTRTSNDNSTWSSWSSDLASGGTVSSPLGKYLQLQYTLTGSGTVTPNLNDYQVNFTTDNVPPTISNIVETPASTSVAISWNTNEIASTKVDYGLTSSYGSTTSETDTSPRVTSHSVSLTGLSSCVTYHYRVRSIDAFLNETIGSDNTFTTTGCTGSAAVDSQNTVSVTTTSGGTVALTSGQTGISLSVPSGFAGTDATFQIKQLDKTSVISSTSTPVSYSTIGSYIYDLKALSDVSTTISSFLKPISITLTYASSDVSGIDESSLKIYRWDGAGWNLLSSCTVDTGTRKVTCTTTGFSIFGLFGQTSTTSSSSSSSSGSTSTGSDNNCTRLPPGAKAPEIYAAIPDGLNGVKLYFTDASQPFDKYVLEYGLESGKYIYGADNIGEAGTRTYRVGFLNKNTNYWFRVRAMNGCMPGPWSNEFVGNTKGGLANLAQETGVKRSKAASTLLKEVPLTETNISPAVETVVPTEVQNKPVVMPTESPTTTPTQPNFLEGIGIWIIDLAKSVFSGKF